VKVGLHGKDFQDQSRPAVLGVIGYLQKRKAEIYVSDKFAEGLRAEGISHQYPVFLKRQSELPFDTLLSLGGDGKMLESVMYASQAGVPILGINTGRMGFLATTGKEQIEEALNDLWNGSYSIEERIMLELVSDQSVLGDFPFALNDFTIMKKDSSFMITVHVFVDGEKLNSYWADGLIISTPTGSTGYALSCGGPLVSPQSNSFIITAVSPHNLGTRPFVIPDTSEISFKVEGRSERFLVSLDSRIDSVTEEVELKIKRAQLKAKLVQPKGYHYFNTLRQKLNWGMDVRN